MYGKNNKNFEITKRPFSPLVKYFYIFVPEFNLMEMKNTIWSKLFSPLYPLKGVIGIFQQFSEFEANIIFRGQGVKQIWNTVQIN